MGKFRDVIDLKSDEVGHTSDEPLIQRIMDQERDCIHAIQSLDEPDKIEDLHLNHGTSVDMLIGAARTLKLHLDLMRTENDALVMGFDEIIKMIPLHVVFDAKSLAAQQAERWLEDNAEGGYNIVGLLNVCIITFIEESDWTLFKVRFSV